MKKIRFLAMIVIAACLFATSAFAIEIAPSVEAQDAPEVTVQEPIVVNGAEVELLITPMSRVDAEGTPEEVSERLNAAIQDILDAPSLGDLPTENGTVADAVDKQLEGTGFTSEDLVVRDLFDLALVDEDGKVVEPEEPVTLTFVNAVAPDETFIVLNMVAEGVWEVVDPEKVQINADGSVTITFDNLGRVAFVTTGNSGTEPEEPTEPEKPGEPDVPTQPDQPDTVTSPQTGETTNGYMVIAMLMLLAGAVYCGTRAKRAFH